VFVSAMSVSMQHVNFKTTRLYVADKDASQPQLNDDDKTRTI
jgi:hypothetical protein